MVVVERSAASAVEVAQLGFRLKFEFLVHYDQTIRSILGSVHFDLFGSFQFIRLSFVSDLIRVLSGQPWSTGRSKSANRPNPINYWVRFGSVSSSGQTR
ncbi:hypothetical protein Hdeb2414_s0002g00067231 [Helianthus debilis subsp. tardiflorus]